jgi:NADPH2:quinone reductase
MKAIQVKQTGGPEAMDLVDLPVPQPQPNEAVVKIQAAGVNYVDVYLREGRYKAPLPLIVGQEAAGIVSAVGSDARTVASGTGLPTLALWEATLSTPRYQSIGW